MEMGTGNVLTHHAEGECKIDKEEPYIARSPVQHAPHQGLLACQARHLSVGGIAEVGQHQQHHAKDVVSQICEVEHATSGGAEENAQDGDGVGMHAEFIPEEGKHQSDGACEVYVEPFFCIVGFKRCL